MLTLIRNLGSAVGISTVIAFLTSKTTEMHARLAEHITPFNDALRDAGPLLDPSTDQGRALLDALITQQATVIAYQNDFKLLMIFTLVTMPFVLLIGSSHQADARRTRGATAYSRQPGVRSAARDQPTEAGGSARSHPLALPANSALILALCSPTAGTGPYCRSSPAQRAAGAG